MAPRPCVWCDRTYQPNRSNQIVCGASECLRLQRNYRRWYRYHTDPEARAAMNAAVRAWRRTELGKARSRAQQARWRAKNPDAWHAIELRHNQKRNEQRLTGRKTADG